MLEAGKLKTVILAQHKLTIVVQQILQLIYITTIGVAFIASLRSFRLPMGLHLKVFSIVLGATFLVEFFCAFLLKKFGLKTNIHIYNVFTFFEFLGFAWYYLLQATNKIEKIIIRLFLILFPITWYIMVIRINGLYKWDSLMQVIAAVFIICNSLYYYFKLLVSEEIIDLKTQPGFWIATGMIIFYACNLPYLGMLDYLINHYPLLAGDFILVLLVLDIIMYILFTYAYICQKSFLYKTEQKLK